MNYKDIIIRALKTFVQAFVPVVVAAFAAADLTEFDNIKTVAYSALISGVAAGLSAVWNIILQLLEKPNTTYATSGYVYIPDDETNLEDCDEYDTTEGIEPEDGGFSC